MDKVEDLQGKPFICPESGEQVNYLICSKRPDCLCGTFTQMAWKINKILAERSLSR